MKNLLPERDDGVRSRRRRGSRPRAPIDVYGGRPPSDSEFWKAVELVEQSGVLPALEDRLDSRVGRPRSLSIKGFLVAWVINGSRRNHRGQIVDIARVLDSLLPWQRRVLGIKDWIRDEAYDRTDRLFNKLTGSLQDGWEASVGGSTVRIDTDWFGRRFAFASATQFPLQSGSRAIDGTDLETWGALQGDVETIDVDGVGEEPLGGRSPDGGPPRRGKSKARVRGIGPDGRKIYTADPDARAGRRSATNSRPSGPFIGYEVHAVAQAPELRWSDGIERVKLGPEVPAVVTDFAVGPAGGHRTESVVPRLIAAKESGEDIREVVWDRGYSQLSPESHSHPLNRAGVEQTFQLMPHQLRMTPFNSDIIILDEQMFSRHLPEHLRGPIPMPPVGASDEERRRYEQAINLRARFRYTRHAGPDADGATRWRCPFHSGLLRSRSLPWTMRRSRNAPLVDLAPGEKCCSGTVSVSASELPYRQRLTHGTTAWRRSMGRRQHVESVNSGLKGGFANIERKFLRVMGLAKIKFVLTFTIVGYNLDRVRSFLAKAAAMRAQEGTRKRRAKRRRGTWSELLDGGQASERDPPPSR